MFSLNKFFISFRIETGDGEKKVPIVAWQSSLLPYTGISTDNVDIFYGWQSEGIVLHHFIVPLEWISQSEHMGL